MKIAKLAVVIAFAFGRQTVHADFTDNFSSPTTDPAWTTNANGPAPAIWGDSTGGGAFYGYMLIGVSSTEYISLEPYEGIVRPVKPVNSGFDCTWTISASIDGGTTPTSIQAAKIITATTGGGSTYNFALVVSAGGVYELGIWRNTNISSALYFPIAHYLGANYLEISSDPTGNINYWLLNPIVGSQLMYTETNAYLSDPNWSNLQTFGLGSENYGGSYNAWWKNASAVTYPAPPVPNPTIAVSADGASVTVSWPNTALFQLQQCVNLSQANSWMINSGAVTTSNGSNFVTMASSMSGGMFFRLCQP